MTSRTVSVQLKAEIGQYVSGMSKAAAATMRVGEAAKKTQVDSSKGFDLAGKGALLMGGALVAGLGMAIKKSMDFEKSMSAVQAATQASGSTLDALRATAIKAGAATMYSATEAANAITEMGKAGVSAKDIMGGGLTGALNLAAAGQMNVADAAGIASTAMTQFGLTGAQIPHVADLLAAGAGKAMGSVDDLGQALNQAGLLASATGVSIEETTGTLAAFASAGLIGSDAGTSFKTMLQQLQAPSKQSADLMKQLGINAYDTKGNFVGISALAQELKDKLGPLTQAERDHALAQIFGTDAARAANVLYRQGAQGIQDWTKKVNDAGYAQRQASQLTNNLSGDLERLGGSFDTFLISAGTGAQGPLRELVQMLTGVVNVAGDAATAFGHLPGPVQAAVLGFTALVLLRGPLDAMFTRLSLTLVSSVTGLGMATGATNMFSLAVGAARVAVAKLVTAAAPLAVLVATAYAITDIVRFTHAGDDAAKTVDDLEKSLRGLNNSGWASTASAGMDDLKKKIAAAQAIVDKSNNESFIHHTFIGQFTTDSSTIVDAKKSVADLNAELAKLEHQQTATNATADTLAKGMGISRDQVIQLADKYHINLADGLATARLQFGEYDDAQARSNKTTDAGSPSRDILINQLQSMSKAASDAKQETDLFKLSLDILTGKTVDTATVEAAFYDAVAKADGAMKGMHGSVLDAAGSLNVQSEAGRKAQGVLFAVRDAGDQVIATMIHNGATADQVNAKDAQLRESFIKTAMQMGISRAAAEKLANQIYGIPSERKTTITADTKQASGAVDNIQRKINGLTGKTVTITAEYLASNGRYTNLTGHAVASVYADGGYTGPGGKYTPAGIVHAGEVVWSQDDVAAHGGPGRVDAMRQSRPGYASGDVVGKAPIAIDFGYTFSNLARIASAMATASAPGPGAGAERWRGVVMQVLSMLGQSPLFANGILQMIQAESGGNPSAINLTDSNARAGHPSQGLMQTIPSTFYAYAGGLAGRGITDPLANIYAGVNYALHRYGASMLASGGNHVGGKYVGYEKGTPFVPNDGLAYLHKGEAVVPAEINRRSREMSSASQGGWGGGSGSPNVTVNARVFVGSREITDIARVEAEAVFVAANGRQARDYRSAR